MQQKFITDIKTTTNLDNLKEIEAEIFARKDGWLTSQMKDLRNLENEAKAKRGQELNQIRIELQNSLDQQRTKLELEIEQKQLAEDYLDVTAPALPPRPVGKLHLLTKITRDLEDFFISMGFLVVDEPEIETDFFNFQALNIPENHPARDMQDTFYVENKNNNTKYVLRTQTSNAWSRGLTKHKTQIENGEIIKIVAPGRVFRNEDPDTTHDHTFHQFECCVVGTDIGMQHLLQAMDDIIHHLFGDKITTRVRPGYFPFVEPGLEVDATCLFCKGTGCHSCKDAGWIEMMGAGLIHPNVLKTADLDSKKYSGFAFGFGITRLAMLKYGIKDVRLLHNSALHQNI